MFILNFSKMKRVRLSVLFDELLGFIGGHMDTVWPQSSVYLFPSQTRSSVRQPSEVSCPGDRHGADFKEMLNHRQDDCCVVRLTLGAVVDTGESLMEILRISKQE